MRADPQQLFYQKIKYVNPLNQKVSLSIILLFVLDSADR